MAIIFPEYSPPDFLQETLEEIHARMLASLPPDIDLSDAQFPWDFTRPTAIEKARTIQFQFNEFIKQMFPQWATGYWLELHAETRSVSRHPPVAATGIMYIVGNPGIIFPVGFIFSTVGRMDAPTIEYETTESAVIPEEGELFISVVCTQPGIIGNIAENTVILMVEPIDGITSVTNPERMTGGTEAETDDSLRDRLFLANEVNSFIGNISDYRRWALDVPGIGSVAVQDAWAGPFTVRLLLTDEQGQPASEALQIAVYNHIASPDDRQSRLMPVGVELTTEAASALNIRYAATIFLMSGATIESVTEAFIDELDLLYSEAVDTGILRYTRIGAVLSKTVGVLDYQGMTVNEDIKNIDIPAQFFPVTEAVNFIE